MNENPVNAVARIPGAIKPNEDNKPPIAGPIKKAKPNVIPILVICFVRSSRDTTSPITALAIGN